MAKSKYKKGTFITVPSKYRLMELSSYSQVVYMWLADHADKEGKCWPSVGRLAKLCHICKGRVRKSIYELEEMGLVSIKYRKKNDGTNKSNYYWVIEDDYIPREKRYRSSDEPDESSDDRWGSFDDWGIGSNVFANTNPFI